MSHPSNTNKNPQVMGILNITPDSFSDGGKFMHTKQAIEHALNMVEAGAQFIDIGAESSRPGSLAIDVEEEWQRLAPILLPLATLLPSHVCLSVDTYKPEIAVRALDAGAGMINDIYGAREPKIRQLIAQYQAKICIMHMQNYPHNMQNNAQYNDVVHDVQHFLHQQAQQCVLDGILPSNIVLDPGFGFGKKLHHHLDMLKHFGQFALSPFDDAQILSAEQLYLLAGISNKSLVGELTGRSIDQRLAGNCALHMTLLMQGAHILRTHDVAEAIDIIAVFKQLNQH